MTTTDTRRIRRLKEPHSLRVRTDANGNPTAISSSTPGRVQSPTTTGQDRGVRQPQHVMSTSFNTGISSQHAWAPVTLLRRPWRIDQLWWRPGGAISRRYFHIALEDQPPITIFQDLLTGVWYRQNY
jgi:hypothetical protein